MSQLDQNAASQIAACVASAVSQSELTLRASALDYAIRSFHDQRPTGEIIARAHEFAAFLRMR